MRSAFDGFAAYLGILGLIAATVEKVAREVVFLQRTEIAEAEERFETGKVGSSTMAQKRNPAHAQNIAGIAQILRSRVPLANESIAAPQRGRRHGRQRRRHAGAGDGDPGRLRGGRAGHAAGGPGGASGGDAAEPRPHGRRHPVRGHHDGLARRIGRHHARHVLYDTAMQAAGGGISFVEALRQHPLLDRHKEALDLEALLDPVNYVGEAADCVDDEIRR